ncbi:NUC173 domain-containing protein [Verticillium dahliae]|nr:NUC173 domain-containing protein [Verticillium dahliae]
MATPTLDDKLDKIRSPGLQSQQRVFVVLQAVDATLKEQNTPPSPTGYFAALLGLLSQSIESGSISSETTSSVVYLLDVVTPYAPQPLLRAKFTQILTLLAPILLLQDAEAMLLRASIGCLESLLLAQDLPAWDLGVTQIGPRRAVAGLLNLAQDAKPKIRKRAQDALKKVLTNPPPSPSLDHPAADMCAHTALATLEDLAAKAAQARKTQKKATSAESQHDPALLHALQLVKTIASASGGWPSNKIESLCELLLAIARTGGEYMTVATFDIFEMIFAGMAADDAAASSKLPRLIEIISELRPAANDTQLIPPWLAILSRGYDVSAQLEPEDTFQNLPDLFTMVLAFLESPSHNIRISASECLVSFLANCVPASVIIEPSVYDEKTLDKVAKAAETLLSVKYQAAWPESFNVFGAMFDTLRWRADPAMLTILRAVGDLRSNDSFGGKKEADDVIGRAIRAVGPDAVLAVLPLNLATPAKGQPGRAWMFPLLRDYVSNTNLAHFRAEMVPLSELMFQRVLDHGDAAKTMEVKIYETLVQQIWATLPGYCDLPLDLAAAFDQTFAELLANLLYKQVELRLEVCRALKTLIESNQAIAELEDAADDMVRQSRVPRETARANLAYLGTYAGNMLAVLFNVYTQTLPQSRGPILLSINAFLSITPAAELRDTFDRVSAMLAAELQNKAPEVAADKGAAPPQKKQGQDQPPSTTNTLMDLIITMSVYLPRDSFAALFDMASVTIVRQDQPQLQKKAYKLIPRLAESETGRAALAERTSELQAMFIASADKVSAPARRERLAALSALLPFVPDTSLHFIPSILSEVVICCKENNERAREAAYGLLVGMGERMAAADGAAIDNAKVPHMPRDAPAGTANIEEYLTMVSAGLVGSTPHMISASVTALSRVLYEFRPLLNQQTLADLVATMDLFLTSNNREIVKSVLGFVKICVVGLPTDMMIPRLQTLTPNLIIWSHEHKGHFKSRVKHILERMVRRFGFDLVNRYCPEDDRKLLANIRKTKARNKRKKDAAREAAGDDADSDDEQAGGKHTRKFDNEYDEALYSSDSDDDGPSDDNDDDDGGSSRFARGANARKVKGRGSAYIVEDEDEPLDLLDRNALASISSTKPVKARKPSRTKAKVDLDGKLILGRDDDDDDNEAGGAMDVDNPDASGVGAYVAALKGKDVAQRGRGGKLKFSNKNRKDQHDDDMDEDMDEGTAHAVKAHVARGRGGFGRGFGGGRGRGGPGGRGGRGGIASGRRGLGEDRRRGGFGGGGGGGGPRGGIQKSPRGRR